MALLLLGCGGAGAPDHDGDVPGDDSLDQCFAGLQPRAPDYSYLQIDRFATADGRYLVQLGRDPADNVGTAGTTPFELVRAAVVAPQEEACITDAAALDYVLTHHNYDDVATVSGAHARYRVTLSSDLLVTPRTWNYELTVLELASDTVVEGPLTLVLQSCRATPSMHGGC